jgi:hypothetical protein
VSKTEPLAIPCPDVPHWHRINDAGARVLCTPADVPECVRRREAGPPERTRGRSRHALRSGRTR